MSIAAQQSYDVRLGYSRAPRVDRLPAHARRCEFQNRRQ